MITKTFLSPLIFFTFSILNGFTQTFNNPAIGLKSHQTMEVIKVEVIEGRTIIHLTIENRRSGGTFCADKNIYIVCPDGTRLKMEKSRGIPQCPENYKFKSIGEKLEFSFSFTALKQGTGWIDLVEECNDNCFRIYGILLNNDFTSKIDEALELVDNGQVDTAIALYKELIEKTRKTEEGITGSLYSDLITLLINKGYSANASEWYLKLAKSSVAHKQLYLDNLNSRGVKF